jgi:hypothetical protein
LSPTWRDIDAELLQALVLREYRIGNASTGLFERPCPLRRPRRRAALSAPACGIDAIGLELKKESVTTASS